jgi:uncharacterized protein (TIGR01777 family)
MNVAITGASGFVGRRLTERLHRRGHTTKAVSLRSVPSAEDLAGCDAVIHLAGEPVSQRWSAAVKRNILESREEGTRRLLAALRSRPPNVLVSASAVGYYGSRGDEVLTEQSSPASDFLGQVAVAWEREALEAEKLGVRVIRLRIGVVLGAGGGALSRMLLPFRLGLGGRIGNGRQWMSWIHIDDLCDLAAFVLPESTLRGAMNATSPLPVTNAEFTKALARAVHRPAVMPVPAFALKLLFGEMAQVILASQRAVPQAAQRAGFEFQYPEIAGALLQILS